MESVIRKVAFHLGLPAPEDKMKELLNYLSIPSMRQNPSVNFENMIKLNKMCNLTTADGQFIRSGTVDQWKESMSPEMIQRFDEWIADNIKNSDFSFDNN